MMIKHKDFEDFLMWEFSQGDGNTVLDDDLPDAFEDWLAERDPDDWVLSGEKWAAYKLKEVVGEFCNLEIK